MSNEGQEWKLHRYVGGPNSARKSCVLIDKATNVIRKLGDLHRAELWLTAEMPVDNTITEDRSLLSKTREPLPRGTLFRALELEPNAENTEERRAEAERFHRQVGQKHMPSEEDYKRHFTIHRTDTVDYVTCVRGEIWLITDTDEVIMRPGDTAVIRGVNHGWVNKSDQPCLLVFTIIDAKPWD